MNNLPFQTVLQVYDQLQWRSGGRGRGVRTPPCLSTVGTGKPSRHIFDKNDYKGKKEISEIFNKIKYKLKLKAKKSSNLAVFFFSIT